MMTREGWGASLTAIGAYVIVGDFLDTSNYWPVGLVWLLIGALLFLWPEGKR